MERRTFLRVGLGAAAGGVMFPNVRPALASALPLQDAFAPLGPVRSIVPVVGDGRWVWTKPPVDQTGYLEPRPFELKVGIELEGTGNAFQVMATTPAPVQHPEQKIDRSHIDTQGCVAQLRALSPEAGQLVLAAPQIVKGQVVRAAATFRLTLFKQYHGFERDRFPAEQSLPASFRNQYRSDSPGIQTRDREVRDLAAQLGEQLLHPWDRAKAFYEWVWQNIRPRIGSFTNVLAALKDRVGDCEERAAVFVALCRASGIPARLVWVPNHNWAEFYLLDHEGEGHWIPSHTAAYSWFGWTGAHELVIQKGDNIRVPEKHKTYRLLEDWMQWRGAKPRARYLAELTPLPPQDAAEADVAAAGPGARRKDETGEWKLVGSHPLDARLRDGPAAQATWQWRPASSRELAHPAGTTP